MDTKEITVSDLAQEQIEKRGTIISVDPEKNRRKKREKNSHIGIRRFWCW